ncbi:coiled-coil domain-containing protein 120 isoform X2 [Brachyhypopomus gauderio]|uniref:coiled-coil domain-containing protein 120 isoform X2 n=1 Tax=Brachyhypopomus gauderio TaxID=698409 RepID=UPI0040425BEA
MEVKGHLNTDMGPDVQGTGENMQQAERLSELQDRKQTLQTLLNSRLDELRQVCLLEAELTGKLPRAFPLDVGDRPPFIQRRLGLPPPPLSRAEDDLVQRRQVKLLLGGGLRRTVESDTTTMHGKRTVHRGCHTEESSPSMAQGERSLSHPRLALASPDSHLCRKPSPVEIYYEMRTRRNSASSSVSPSHSLPRSTSNTEGRSVPATPLLSRTAPISIHMRPDPAGAPVKQQNSSPDIPQFVPLASLESSSSDCRGCPYSSRARRSNSTEALLDRSSLQESLGPRDGAHTRGGMPPRAGPYKSSESLMDGKLRQVYWGSPERPLGGAEEQGRTRSSVGGRASGVGYSEILMDYIWGKQQSRAAPPALRQSAGQAWPNLPAAATPPHYNGFSHSQIHLAAAPPPYGPVLLSEPQAESRRVKVTRTKSCGPFIPLQQQDAVLLSPYEPTHPASSSPTSSIPNLLPLQAELPPTAGAAFSCRPVPFSLPTPDDSVRSLHKALALEGLRDWYLRNALGYSTPAKGHEGLPLRHAQHLASQGQSVPLDPLYSHRQMPQSASFHGHPLRGRSLELSLYSEPFLSQKPTPKEAGTDPAAPGTLV